MEMLETSAKSGENVLKAFEKLIGIVHNKALEANSKNKNGIRGMNGAGSEGFKLDGSNDKSSDAGACGC